MLSGFIRAVIARVRRVIVSAHQPNLGQAGLLRVTELAFAIYANLPVQQGRGRPSRGLQLRPLA